MHRPCLVLILCTFGALAFRLDHDFGDFRNGQDDLVGPEHKPTDADDDDDKNAKCKKNILVLLDTSPTVKNDNFNNKVKPFLRKFIHDSRLNVSREGTHIAFVAFGREIKELVLFNQGNTSYTTSSLNKTITDWKWEDIRTGGTRTDLALQTAIEIFIKSRDKLDERNKYDDVILLITDGKPEGYLNTTQTGYTEVSDDYVGKEAVITAKKLMDKEVVIVGLWVGDVPKDDVDREERKNNTDILGTMSSPGKVFNATFENIDTIMKSIVNGTCDPVNTTNGPGKPKCNCPATGSAPVYFTEPGSSTLEVSWKIPEPVCKRTATKIDLIATSPSNVESGSSFPIGRYKIEYTFSANGEILEEKCHFTFEVKGPVCGGKAYSSRNQVCCCGRIHDKMDTYECCGNGYYSKATQKCCDAGSTVRDKDQSCDNGPPCTCSPAVNITAKAAPGNTSAVVTWSEPRPSCNERVNDIRVVPNYYSGQSIPIGQHVVRYTYEINTQFTLTCDVNIEVRGELCGKEGFNPSTQECCCGAVHKFIQGYECCGQDYYSSEVKQCCPNSVVWDKELSCPGQNRLIQ